MWELFAFFLGVFGGLAGVYILLFPVTLVLPVLLVTLSRRHRKGPSTLLSYAAGLVIIALWLLSLQTGSGHTTTTAAFVTVGVLVALAATMAMFSRTRIVRGPR